MQIISNTAFLNSFLHSIQNTIQSLTPLQKKVVLVVTAILTSGLCLYYTVRYFKAKPVEKEKIEEKQPIEKLVTDLPEGPLTTDKIKSIEIDPIVMATAPPQYTVKITLANGYQKSIQLEYNHLHLLATYVPKEKIIGTYRVEDVDHNAYLYNQAINEDAANRLLVYKLS